MNDIDLITPATHNHPGNPQRRVLLKIGLLAGTSLALGALGKTFASGHVKVTHDTTPTLYIDVGGVRYAYRRLGPDHGVPVLLMQHFRGTMDGWDPAVTDGLARSRPVILFDNRGVGSTGGETPTDIMAMTADVAAFVEALGLTQIDLLGYSMGGFVAQELALRRPGLIRRMILAGTGPQGGSGMQVYSPEVLAAVARYPDDGSIREFLFFSPSTSSQAAGKRFIERAKQRRNRGPSVSLQTTQAQSAAIANWGAASSESYNQRLSGLKQPCLIVNGSDDILVPTINSLTLFQHIPDAQLILYPDAGHGALFQYPDRFVRHAIQFLDEHAALST